MTIKKILDIIWILVENEALDEEKEVTCICLEKDDAEIICDISGLLIANNGSLEIHAFEKE